MLNSKYFWIFILLSVLLSCESQWQQSFSFVPNEGIIVFDNFSGQPDSLGILSEIPAFSKGGYFSGDGSGQGLLPGNRNKRL